MSPFICFVSVRINSLILPNLAAPFPEECSLEHPRRLVSIPPLHLTRKAALFLSNQSEGPLKNPHHPLNANTSVFAALLATARVIPGTGIPRNWVLWSVPVSMVPPCQKRFFSGPDVFEKAPREKMALCPEVPSPPRAEFLCDSGRVGVARCGGRKGKEGGEKTQKRHVWVLARCHASVRSPGGRVTVGVHGREVKKASLYSFTPVNTHSTPFCSGQLPGCWC